MAKRPNVDRTHKLHLDLSDIAHEQLKRLQVAYPFSSCRAIAIHLLEHALANGTVPSGMPQPKEKGEPDEGAA